MCFMLYLGQGIFELLIAAQELQHRTPSKVRKPVLLQGIPACVGSLEFIPSFFVSFSVLIESVGQ